MKSNHHTPPRFAARLLSWLLADDWQTPAGDFEEYYNHLADSDGERAAKSWYRRQVLALLPERLLEKTIWSIVMFFNNLKVAIRTFQRHRWYATINIGGLAIGIAACILIVLFIQDELSFDRQHDKSDRIARIIEARTTPDGAEQHFAYTMGPLGDAMAEELPGVEQSIKAITSWSVGRQTVQFADNRFYESEYLYTDNAFFEIFDYEWLVGNPNEALSGPNKAVLTQTAARKYFGDVDPIGKVFNVERDGDYTVSGLIANPPSNSHLDFSMVLSLDTYRTNERWKAWMANWESTGFITYVLLEQGADFDTVAASMADLFARRASDETLRSRTPILQPLTNIHFGSSHIDFDVNQGRAEASTIYMFAVIALFIVLIACINYTNMATASSLQRAKEVGLRKSVGANKNQLMRQFLSESILTTFAALLIAIVLAWLALPLFSAIAGKHLTLSLHANLGLLLVFFVLLILIGILSGSYPAFLMSSFDPARVLKGRVSLKSGASRMRQGLVIVQFTLSIGLIIASLVVSKQLDYVQEKRLGFNENQLVVIDINDGNSRANFQSMKSDLASDASVLAVSVSSNVPGDWKNITQIDIEATENNPGHIISSHFLGVDEDFLDTYEIELLEGRNLSEASLADSLSILMNRSGAERLGIRIGDRVQIPGGSLQGRFSDTVFEPQVVGIVEDFHFKSLHERVGPMVLGFHSNPVDVIDYFAVRVDGQNITRSLEHLRAVGERYDPRHPFEFNFLDERLADFYETETRLGDVFSFSTVLAVLIACLGLFGLAAFTTALRTKEIGVRKVLGASTTNILVLLSKNILTMIGISFVIAAPITFLLMKQWLQAFAYQTNIGMGILAAALGLSFAFALIAVSYQSIRVATTDPVQSLRYE